MKLKNSDTHDGAVTGAHLTDSGVLRHLTAELDGRETALGVIDLITQDDWISDVARLAGPTIGQFLVVY